MIQSSRACRADERSGADRVHRTLHAPHPSRATGTLLALPQVPESKPARTSGVVSGHGTLLRIWPDSHPVGGMAERFVSRINLGRNAPPRLLGLGGECLRGSTEQSFPGCSTSLLLKGGG